MPRTVTKQVFQYDELSDAAKAKARDWYIELLDSSDFTNVLEEAERFAEMMGFRFKTHTVRTMGGKERQEPNIWWSVSYSQGDGACIEGSYSYAKGAPTALAKEIGDDHEVVKIAEALQALQKAHGYKLRADLTQGNSHYSHEHTIDFDVFKGEDYVDGDVAKEIARLWRQYMKWIHKMLLEEDEYMRSEESVADNIRANEYEFEADGRRTRD